MNVREFEGCKPQIGERVYVDPAAVVIGDVVLGDDVSIWPIAVIRGDVNSISVGQRTNIQDGSVLHVTHDGRFTPGGFALAVGDDVTVGHQATLHACTVGNSCLIGMGARVMDGATLGDHVFLAAGCLVPPGKILESRTLYRGSPARKVRELGDDDIAMLDYSASHYVRLKDRYLQFSR